MLNYQRVRFITDFAMVRVWFCPNLGELQLGRLPHDRTLFSHSHSHTSIYGSAWKQPAWQGAAMGPWKDPKSIWGSGFKTQLSCRTRFNFRVFAHKTCQIPDTKTVPRFLERLAIRNSWVVSQAAKFSTTNTANSATDTAAPPVLWPPKQFQPAHDARRLPGGLPWARSPRGCAGEVHGARSYEMVWIKMWDPRIRRLWFSTKIYIIPYNWGYNPFTKWDDV